MNPAWWMFPGKSLRLEAFLWPADSDGIVTPERAHLRPEVDFEVKPPLETRCSAQFSVSHLVASVSTEARRSLAARGQERQFCWESCMN
jgi:hypothetical protein